ncbi:MAG: valine--tRNA ligase [Bacteroidota bacterium]|nr:valine--tRNA ligase [Bacteroidota bacterium]
MELNKHYDPASVENKWSAHWNANHYFNSFPDHRKPYTVVIPPPNVTGVLHMGHTLNETVQDILVRRARMSGLNACWVPGSDHASIATEARVVAMLKEKGIDKNSLSREAFLKYAFEWKDTYGSIIYDQIAKLGCSVDWNRTSFTMDDHYYRAVIRVFVDLYRKNLIYRGARMIHWDPSARTALSDEEVEYRDVEGILYYVKYPIAGTSDFITIATQRPETIMGDTGVCVNPEDPRYRHLKGKQVIVPLVNRSVPVIFDDYIDISFGTGALKVTPAHDINDYNLGLKHGLPVIETLNEDGSLSPAAEILVGMDRFEARKRIVEMLREEGLLVKEETYATRLGYSQRSHAVVEPRISTQWFVKMKPLAAPALEQVISGNIRIHPGDKFLATYKYWLENVKDWCISRQLWWGQRIPTWYDGKKNFVVAENEQAAIATYQQEFGPLKAGEKLTQDEDVLDTWFSSWLWPMEVFHGITDPDNADFKYYYPGAVLVTGQDIIFFWVARMIMAGMEFKNEKPFSDVYFTGMVRDKQGRKMSKSLGNSPDLLKLIEKYGADAVRFGIMISSPAGNDLLFDEAGPEQGRNFNNKLWTALKLVNMWAARQVVSETGPEKPGSAAIDSTGHFAVQWFENRLEQAKNDIQKLIAEFKISEALKNLYSLIWDDFCSWFLEWVKPGYEQAMLPEVYQKTVSFFEELLQWLHPFMPFVTEEIYHLLKERAAGDDLCIKQFGPVREPDPQVLRAGDDLRLFLTVGREFRQQQQMKNSEPITRVVLAEEIFSNNSVYAIIRKQLNAEAVGFGTKSGENDNGIHWIPFRGSQIGFETGLQPDKTYQKQELEKELIHYRGFLESLNKKLSNEKFMQHAKPEVIDLEKKKKSDTEEKIAAIELVLKG